MLSKSKILTYLHYIPWYKYLVPTSIYKITLLLLLLYQYSGMSSYLVAGGVYIAFLQPYRL